MKRRTTCPICAGPRSQEHKPFCSTRCRDRDLANWLTDGYAIPGEKAPVPTAQEDRED